MRRKWLSLLLCGMMVINPVTVYGSSQYEDGSVDSSYDEYPEIESTSEDDFSYLNDYEGDEITGSEDEEIDSDESDQIVVDEIFDESAEDDSNEMQDQLLLDPQRIILDEEIEIIEEGNSNISLLAENSDSPESDDEEDAKTTVSSGNCGESVIWKLKDDGRLIISGEGAMPNLNNSYEAPWGNDISSITSVIVEEGVTDIGSYSFAFYNNLKSVTLPESLKCIGLCAFANSDKLEEISLPTGLEKIDEGAFAGCRSLGNLVIPESVTHIGFEAFADCKNINVLVIEGLNVELVDDIGRYFDNAKKMDYPIIKAHVGSTADEYSKNMGLFFMPMNQEEDLVNFMIDSDGFLSKYLGHAMEVTIPDGVTYIGSNNFPLTESEPSFMTKVTIPDSVTGIGENVFNGCFLEELNLPDSITTIGRNSIYNCKYLTSVHIPQKMSVIHENVFYNADKITEVTIPSNIKVIEGAFGSCDNLERVVLPEGLITLCGFRNCTKLEEIVIPDSVINLGFYEREPGKFSSSGFASGSSVEHLSFGDNIERISGYDRCENLTEVIFPSGVKEINGFWSCPNLTSVSFPKAVEKINGFDDCANLSQIVFPDTVRIIQGFTLDPGITSIRFPGSVQRISNSFSECENLGEIKFEDIDSNNGKEILREILDSFNMCSSLTSIQIPEAFYVISASFADCPALKDYTIGMNANLNANNSKSLGMMTDKYGVIVPVPGAVIKGYTGSSAYEYANSKNIPFESIGVMPPENDARPIDQRWEDSGYEVTWNKVERATKYNIYLEDTNHNLTLYTTVTDNKIVIPNQYTENASGFLIASANETGDSLQNHRYSHLIYSFMPKPVTKPETKPVQITIEKQPQIINGVISTNPVAVGKTAQISVTGAKGKVTYKSDNPSIAMVNETGLLKAVSVGSTEITIMAAETDTAAAQEQKFIIKVIPASPTVSVANTATGVNVSWKKVAGATGYDVYRGTKKIKSISNGTTTSYTDTTAKTNGTKYTYKVIAKAPTGNSAASAQQTIYFLSRPTLTLSNKKVKTITAKWNANTKATGYEIQYSKKSNFKSGLKKVTVTSAKIKTKALTGVKKGETWYVRMRTYKKSGNKKYYSSWSASKKIKIKK